MNPYITDILSQPDALRKAINKFSIQPLASISQRLNSGIITLLQWTNWITHPTLAQFPIRT